jgi:alkylation response protein AidB-like acyl-CoA dehydrogenase
MGLKLILLEELALAGAPFGPLGGADQTAEVIIRDGTPYLRSEVLPRIGRGEVTFWQGFSEPGAGSDLLSLTTEARRDGDGYVIRGHKIWSSHAGVADYGLVLARTSGRRRNRGLTMLVVANGTPGMDIRPIGPDRRGVSLRGLPGRCPRARRPHARARGEGFQALLAGLDTDRFWGRFYKAPRSRAFCASSWIRQRRCGRTLLARCRRAPPSPPSPPRSGAQAPLHRVGARQSDG